MKKLYILRHAKAKKFSPEGDFERDLSARAKDDIKIMLKRLEPYALRPECFLSSPALRAKKTALKFSEHFNNAPIIYDARLYEADAGQIYEILKQMDERINEMFLVGHNPALLELCEFLGELSMQNFATCSVLGLEFSSFKQLLPGKNKILFYESLKNKS